MEELKVGQILAFEDIDTRKYNPLPHSWLTPLASGMPAESFVLKLSNSWYVLHVTLICITKIK